MGENMFEQVIGFFEEGQSTEALEELEAMFVEDKSNPEYIFYKALILLDAGNYKTAYDGFQSLIPLGGSYEYYARWYLALIEIYNEKYQSARMHLSKLKKVPDSTTRSDASKLYRTIFLRK